MLLSVMEKSNTCAQWGIIESQILADILRDTSGVQKLLLIDSRSFLEFNTCHIQQSVNVCCSKLVKRRLQQDKVHIKDLLSHTCHIDVDEAYDVIVYDQCSENTTMLTDDVFIVVLLQKLALTFKSVTLLKGGFLGFQAMYPNLCESKTNNNYKHTPLTSLSQPCLPVSNVGPTRILPFLYLGSQRDALSQETVQVNGISYILNVSTACPRAPFIQDGHFLRIPVNDNYSEKMQPFFNEAFQFLDTVRNSNGCVLVHCLAGISRSATLAIAYIMKNLNMSSDDAYRYVKEKRPTISPNFNFLGQLLDFEKQLRREGKQESQIPHTQMDLRMPSSPVAKPLRTIHFTPDRLVQCNRLISSCSISSFPVSKSSVCAASPQSAMLVAGGSEAWAASVCKGEEAIPDSATSKPPFPSHKQADMETDSGKAHSSKGIPTSPLPMSLQIKSSTVTRSLPKNSHAPKRATFLALGNSALTKNHQNLPQTGVFAQSASQQSGQLAPCSYCPTADTQTVHNAQSPTTALARLSFVSPTKESKSHISMETQMQLCKFPTTSLDKLNFTPCFVKEDGHSRKKSGATKRPLSASVVEEQTCDTLNSPTNSTASSSGSSASPVSGQTKVVLRSRDNKAKRAMVRPNSIAFSSYPTFDLGSDCQNSPCSSSSTSQDDSSEAYGSKKLRPCYSDHYVPRGYSEKHLYKQITAAMESAMIKTQAYGDSSRKARSLDDILNSGDEEAMETDCNCNSTMGKLPRCCGPRKDLYTPTPMFDGLPCLCRTTSDPYQSNSSISSSGSHGSLHGSLEIIQAP
ncbi:tyrosine-protein phosphatase vhp-1-like [Liolophura sinensis]|uniref:tyrosine-protein phosphatase vhp-1-like n=1 Tax=Liolophura sinensis TaxID=3198878 RepID=UPI003158594B